MIRLLVALALGSILLSVAATTSAPVLVWIDARRADEQRLREFERAVSLLRSDLARERSPGSGAHFEVGPDGSMRWGPLIAREGERVWHEWHPLPTEGWEWWRVTEGGSRALVLIDEAIRIERLGGAGSEAWPEFAPVESPVEHREGATEVWYDRDFDRVWSAHATQEIAGERWFSYGPDGARGLFQRATGGVLQFTLQPIGHPVRVGWNASDADG